MTWSSRKKIRAFLYRSFCPKESFLTFVFQLNAQCIEYHFGIEYTFRIYILLHIKKHYFKHFFCLFLKSPKAFSVSLNKKKCLPFNIILKSKIIHGLTYRNKYLFQNLYSGKVSETIIKLNAITTAKNFLVQHFQKMSTEVFT